MKILVTNGQPVPEHSDLVVSAPTGEYGPFDLVECARIGAPGLPICAYQAQYLQYGAVAYRDGEYLSLLKQAGLVNDEPKTLADMVREDSASVVGQPGTVDAPAPVAPAPSPAPEPTPEPVPVPVPEPRLIPRKPKPSAGPIDLAPAPAADTGTGKFVEEMLSPEVQAAP